ncbi:MAG: AAA family ATPase [Polyangiaceae bacterium]
MNQAPQLTPLLVARDAVEAIAFYEQAFGANERVRFMNTPLGVLAHADLTIGTAQFSLTEELPNFNSDAPPTLGGSPVVLQLKVTDVDAAVERATRAGAVVVFPIGEWRTHGAATRSVRAPVDREPGDRGTQRRRTAETPGRFDRVLHQRGQRITMTKLPQGGAVWQPGTTSSGIHLILGPVGAGKTTYARKLAKSLAAPVFDLDDWMATLFGDDPRPDQGRVAWYLERKERCVRQIWVTASELLRLGRPVVLELGLVRRTERQAFYDRAEGEGFELILHLLDAPRDERRRRVLMRNETRSETFSMVVPLEYFELASDAWEPLADDEVTGRRVLAKHG